MRIPTFVLEGIKLPRVILSIQPSMGSDVQEAVSLMKASYEMGVLCFDLPTKNHLEAFRELKNLVEDESVIALSHVEAGEGASLLGKPLHSLVYPTLFLNSCYVANSFGRFLHP